MERYQRIMHLIAVIALVSFVGVLLVQIGAMFRDNLRLKAQLDEIIGEKERIIEENNSFSERIEYLSNPVNLEKELRSKFNYKRPGEEMMIIVDQ